MKYPVKIRLIKETTLPDAVVPQEEKYPSGSVVSQGYMWEHTRPTLDTKFYVMATKIYPLFVTSRVNKILESTDEYIRFKTLNSIYKIEFL